jgi:hypothetical protein
MVIGSNKNRVEFSGIFIMKIQKGERKVGNKAKMY